MANKIALVLGLLIMVTGAVRSPSIAGFLSWLTSPIGLISFLCVAVGAFSSAKKEGSKTGSENPAAIMEPQTTSGGLLGSSLCPFCNSDWVSFTSSHTAQCGKCGREWDVPERLGGHTAEAASFEEGTFRQTYALRLLCAFLLLSPAAFLLSRAANDESHESDGTRHLVAVGLVLVVVVLWAVIARTRLTINAIGIRLESVLGIQEVAWTDITEISVSSSPISLPRMWRFIMVDVMALPPPANLTLQVIGCNRNKLTITSNFRRAKDVIDSILGRVLPPMVADVRSRIEHGEVVHFGQLMLSKTELIWKNRVAIPVVELGEVEIVGSAIFGVHTGCMLRVRKLGERRNAIYDSIYNRSVTNDLVLSKVLEPILRQNRSQYGLSRLAQRCVKEGSVDPTILLLAQRGLKEGEDAGTGRSWGERMRSWRLSILTTVFNPSRLLRPRTEKKKH